MASNFLDEALDLFHRGKYAACRSVLEGGSAGDRRSSTATQWLVENNLVVCSCRELVRGEEVNHGPMIERLQRLSHMMQGLPPSLKCLSVEMTVFFNISVLLLHEMCMQESISTHLAPTRLAPSRMGSLQDVLGTSLKRALIALGIAVPIQTDLVALLRSAADVTQFAPAGITRLILLQYCLMALGHMITGQRQKAIAILRPFSGKAPKQRQKCMALPALTLTLQAGGLTVDLNGQKDGQAFPSADDLVQFLLAVCLFQTGQWEVCLDVIGAGQLALPGHLMETLTLIQGYCFYEMGNFQSALERSTSLSTSPECDVQTKLKALNLTGCCLATLNKPHTAIQKFQEALRTDFGYLCPLYNISLVYRRLALTEAETEALDLLIQALGERQGSADVPSESVDVILSPFPVSSSQDHYGRYDLTECSHGIAFVTHTLARRLQELDRHSEAAARYKDLLKTLEGDVPLHQSPTRRCGATSCVPTFQDLYLESTLAMYEAEDFEAALRLAERILSKMAPGIGSQGERFDSTPDGSRGGGSLPSSSGRQMRGDALPGYGGRGDGVGVRRASVSLISGDARATLDSERSEDADPGSSAGHAGDSSCRDGSDPRLLVANALLLKASCLMQSGSQTGAMETSDELLDYLKTVTRIVDDEAGALERGTEHKMEEEEASRSKKRKIDSDCDVHSVTDTPPQSRIPRPIGESLLENKAKAYCNKSTLLIGQGNRPEALHMLILAMQCAPDNGDIKHNHALLLRKMGRKEES